ncbi:MAG: hypothetical protein AAF664_08225 [Planctomycetota bacterium]
MAKKLHVIRFGVLLAWVLGIVDFAAIDAQGQQTIRPPRSQNSTTAPPGRRGLRPPVSPQVDPSTMPQASNRRGGAFNRSGRGRIYTPYYPGYYPGIGVGSYYPGAYPYAYPALGRYPALGAAAYYPPAVGLGPALGVGVAPAVLPGAVVGGVATPIVTPVLPSIPPQSTIIDSVDVPNNPLPPVRATLRNDSGATIQVAVLDRFSEETPKRLILQPGQSEVVTVQRDAGGTKVQTVQTFDSFGNSINKTIRQTIPALRRYDVVVHEIQLQSLAIDRTGPVPVIEDSNSRGVPVGRFSLPPGSSFKGGVLPVHQIAARQNNAADVAPILAQE